MTLPVTIEDDPYIPFAFKTYQDSIGAKYYRLGNFHTSLVEIAVDPHSMAIRGVTCVLVDKIGNEIQDDVPLKDTGLPILDLSAYSDRVVDEYEDVYFHLHDRKFSVHWKSEIPITGAYRYGDLEFCVSNDVLVGIVVRNLPLEPTANIKSHLNRLAP